MILRAEAPAKINRELRVGRRRPDGFHEIRSRFCTIDFSDRIEVEEAGSLELSRSGLPVPGDESNLAVRAARALAGRLGIAPRARIRLEKRVPAGAGLGGGSSDAAVTLILLSKLWGSALAPEELSGVAASLGSDVPFFLFGGQADVEGRGERVIPRDDAPATELVLVIPPFSISTAEVYAAYARSTGGAARLPDRLEIETSSTFLGPNDLASAVLETQSEMVEYLHSAGRAASEAGITGSGSALVLRGVTEEAKRELERLHPKATIKRVRTLGREDYRRRISL
ncbi:MAG TPA: 4-(cytidine 5'-diphospho)-2-C-methyl-D-erythritol kinase [Thermoanaerobaculia bacterium]|nr:4-(cytidine 5'-diphospho)-2-C-methyl-D-erythritol kinase [Thermoanaerobaculia bacterium]